MTSAASSAASSSFPDPTKLILQLLKDFLELLRYLAVELLPGPLGDLIAQVLDWFISFVSGPVFTFLAYLVLDPLIYFGPFAPLTSPVLLPAGLTGLAGLGAVSGPAGPMVERVHSDGPSRQSWPAATGVTLVGTNPAALVTTPAPAPTTSAAPTARRLPDPVPPKAFTRSVVPTGKGSTRSPRRQHSPVLPPMPPHLPPNCPATKLRAAPAKQQDCGDVSGNTASSFWPTTAA